MSPEVEYAAILGNARCQETAQGCRSAAADEHCRPLDAASLATLVDLGMSEAQIARYYRLWRHR